MQANRAHCRTEAEKNRRDSQLLKELEEQYGESSSITLDEARAKTELLMRSNSLN
jgi:hypothetical protein